MDIFLAIGGSIFGGTVTGIITVAALKTDVKWVILLHEKLERRVSHLEKGVCR